MVTSDLENPVFFYHLDHLGSTSYVTDFGNVTQHDGVHPDGEIFCGGTQQQFSQLHISSMPKSWTKNGFVIYYEQGI